ncbi:MAG: hypothetical protein JJE46_04995 [Acidimicrobiia bacterium]|nr:hypothetical protein [Acidimicrobiia bacterium]
MRLVVVLVVLVAVVGCRGHVPSTAGISTGSDFLASAPSDQELELGRLAQTGAHWVRLDLDWEIVQPRGPGDWDWSTYDALVRMAERQGLEVLAVPIWTPPWANQGKSLNTPPTDPATYATLVREAVSRHRAGGAAGTKIRAWEIWNEPNNPPFWSTAPDAPGYVDLLRHAYFAAKSVDPDSIIITGGLAPNGDLNQDPHNARHPVNFLKAMYFSGARNAFDAVAHHPYAPVPFSPLTDTPGSIGWNSFAYTKTMHDVMTANGDGWKQIWGTETGPPTGYCPGCVTEQTQVQWLQEEFVQWRTWAWAGPLFWHAGRDGATGSGVAEQNFGLLHSDFSPKPAFHAAAGIW